MLLSDGTVDLARSEAACAYGSLSYSAVIIDPYGLDISVPFSLCMDVGVRNSISRCLTLAAYFTFSGHLPHLLVVSCLARFRKPCNTNTSISQNASTFFAHFSMLYMRGIFCKSAFYSTFHKSIIFHVIICVHCEADNDQGTE